MSVIYRVVPISSLTLYLLFEIFIIKLSRGVGEILRHGLCKLNPFGSNKFRLIIFSLFGISRAYMYELSPVSGGKTYVYLLGGFGDCSGYFSHSYSQ